MEKGIMIWISTVVIFILSGCSKDEDIANELIDYYNNDWIAFQQMKQEALGKNQMELLQQQEQSDEKASNFVEEEVLPNMEEIIDYLHSIKLEHKSIKKLHQLQIEAEEYAYEGIKEYPAYYRGEVTDEEMNEYSEELEQKYDAFFIQLEKMMKKYEVTWDKHSYENGYYQLIPAQD